MEYAQDVALEKGEFVIDQIVNVLKKSATITGVVSTLSNIANDLGVIYIPSLSDEIGPPSGTLRSFLIQFKIQRGREATIRTFCEALQKTHQQLAAEQLERCLLRNIPSVGLTEATSDGQGRDNPSIENAADARHDHHLSSSNSSEHERHQNGDQTVLEHLSSEQPVPTNANRAYDDNDESADLLTHDDDNDSQSESCCQVCSSCVQFYSWMPSLRGFAWMAVVLMLLAVIAAFVVYMLWPTIMGNQTPSPATLTPYVSTTLSPFTTTTPPSSAAPYTAESEKRIQGKSFGHPRGTRSSDIIIHNLSDLSFHLTNTSCSSGAITRDLYPEDQIQSKTSIVFGIENQKFFSGVECDIIYETIPIVPGKPSDGFFKLQVTNPYWSKSKVNSLGNGKFVINTVLQKGDHNKVEFSLYNTNYSNEPLLYRLGG